MKIKQFFFLDISENRYFCSTKYKTTLMAKKGSDNVCLLTIPSFREDRLKVGNIYKSRIIMLLVALFVSIFVNATSNGICGDGLTFRIENGTLTISKTAEGTGKMQNYSGLTSPTQTTPENPSPWWNERLQFTKVIVESGVKSIGEFAFYGCSWINSVQISEGVESVKAYAFYGCAYLTSINLPNSVLEIESGAFDNCRKLNKVYLGKELKRIQDYAFDSTLNKVYCYANKIPEITDKSFRLQHTLYVPNNMIDSYKSVYPWNMFNLILPIAEETAINKVEKERDTKVYLNLRGDKVLNPSKGIYINESKKILIK